MMRSGCENKAHAVNLNILTERFLLEEPTIKTILLQAPVKFLLEYKTDAVTNSVFLLAIHRFFPIFDYITGKTGFLFTKRKVGNT